MTSPRNKLEMTVQLLVFIMAAIQLFYAIFAYLDPAAFAVLRGTDLWAENDADWVQIYASRTAFIGLIILLMLLLKHYRLLMFAALFGLVMPLTDAWLAYASQAASGVIIKHLLTAAYLLVTGVLLWRISRDNY